METLATMEKLIQELTDPSKTKQEVAAIYENWNNYDEVNNACLNLCLPFLYYAICMTLLINFHDFT